MNVSYTFPATKGIQAEKEFFTSTIPYKYLVRLFRFDEEYVPAELRAQRLLNEGRAKGIAQYILENPDTYVLPAITASCDSTMTFTSLSDEHSVGLLQIPLDAQLILNDGQHRRKALEIVLQENPLLADQSVSVTIFADRGLNHSKQVFADINSTAVKVSGSLNALYDLRNPFSRWILEILEKRPAYKRRVDMENANPAKKSSFLWSLVGFHAFINLLTGVTEKNIKTINLEAKTAEVLSFMDAFDFIPMWRSMLDGEIAAEYVRDELVVGNAVFLHALGLFGSHLRDTSVMSRLVNVDPAKGSVQWLNRCVVQGRMRKNTLGVKTTTAKLMTLCGLDLPEDLAAINALCEEGK